MGRKTTVWIFYETNWPDYVRKDMTTKRKSHEKNWISSNSSTKQCHTDQ